MFALEFDGPQHGHSPQFERDAKKDELSKRFGLPLLRIRAEDLCRTEWQLDRLTELITRWFDEQTELVTGDRHMELKPKCPLCGGEMVRKRGKYGPFLSCVRYPACSGACELPGAPNSFKTPVWKTVLITSSICAVVAVVLFLKFNSERRREVVNNLFPTQRRVPQ